MDPTLEMLGRALSVAALLGATLYYAIVVRHRAIRRREARLAVEAEESALRSLVRVLLVDDPKERTPAAG